MALVFPLDLRSSGIRLRSVAFMLMRSVATAKLPTGTQAMETGVAIWRAQVTCRPEREYGRRRAAAFVDALSGTGTALVHSPAQCWPAAHPGGVIAGAWADELTLSGRTETTLSAPAPNASLRLRRGDLVGLEQAGRYGLFRILADAQPSLGVIALEVAPRVPSFFTAGATLRLHQPVCEMMLDPAGEPGMGEGLTMEAVSFAMIQKVA
jgi:hypothetical protein